MRRLALALTTSLLAVAPALAAAPAARTGPAAGRSSDAATSGPLSLAVAVPKPSAGHDWALRLELGNRGTLPIRPSGRATIYSASGREVQQLTVTPPALSPGERHAGHLTMDALYSGSYELDIWVSLAHQRPAHRWIRFEVEPPTATNWVLDHSLLFALLVSLLAGAFTLLALMRSHALPIARR